MKIILANPRGFCAGVERAINTLEKALEIYEKPIYVKHEIVHNKYIIEHFKNRGVIFVENIEEIPDGANAIFSAHGVSKKVVDNAAERGLFTIDATCPLVQKVHRGVVKLHEEGYKIIFIGHAGHPEVEGTMGQVNNENIYLIENENDAREIQFNDTDKIAYATQTTLSLDETANIVSVLKVRFPHIKCPAKDDICYATQNRQNAVKEMVKFVDCLIVIGSKNSSNSNRLRDIGIANGIRSYLIDSPIDISNEVILSAKTIGITAGASAPEILVQGMMDRIREVAGEVVLENLKIIDENVEFYLPKEVRSGKVGT